MSIFMNMDLAQVTHSPGEYVKGVWIEGLPITYPFQGTAQPASGKTLELLPEGKRNSETITVFAPIALSFTTAEPRDQRSGDIIQWENREYEVQIAKKWSVGLLPHWELVATMKKEGET